MPENNLIDVQALGEAKSIDFANKMGENLNKLFDYSRWSQQKCSER